MWGSGLLLLLILFQQSNIEKNHVFIITASFPCKGDENCTEIYKVGTHGRVLRER